MDFNISGIVFGMDTKRILESTKDMSKSTNEIISECNVAQSTAYRKLKKLTRVKFLRIKYVIGKSGRWEMRYQSNLCLVHNTT